MMNIEIPAINSIQQYLFDILAFFSNCQVNSIAEYCQESQNWSEIQRFINDENIHVLPIFFCDPQERNRFNKRSTIVLTQLPRPEKVDENCIGIGMEKSLEDGAVIFLKTNPIKLTEKNFRNELVIFSMNFDRGNIDLLHQLETALLSYLPLIIKADEWKKIHENTDRLKANLLYQLEQNADFFHTIHTSLFNAIQLQKVPIRLRHDTQQVIHPNALLRFAQDGELVQQAEETINEWIKAIDQFYRSTTVVRQFMSDFGPLNEMKYWRQQVIQLHSILNQLRLPRNRAVIYLLNIAASSRSLEWKEIDKKLTQSINEARDHYKFLMITAKHIGALYRNNLNEMKENLPNLFNTIVLINSCSEHYSKPEKITSLLVSINNQIVLSCRNYLTDNQTIDLRSLDRKELLIRIENIHDLYQICREIVLKSKENIENHYHDHLSERHLLGKLDYLHQRLNKFKEISQSLEMYSRLTQSRLDGLEPIVHIYRKTEEEFVNLKFDLFDSNDQQFDVFYQRLYQIFNEIDQKLYQLFEKDLYRILHSPSHNSFNALQHLIRYENLRIPFFDSMEFLVDIIQWYEKEELQRVTKIYNQCRDTPNIERNHPSIIGRILWARRMYKRIQIPYIEFLQRIELKSHPLMQTITEQFIITANGFSIYELLYHRHWYNTLTDVIKALCHPLLARQLYINYDPLIDVILRECELLARYSITMPDLGYKLLLDQHRIRLCYERLKKLVKNHSKLLAKAHPACYELVEKVILQVDHALSIGLNRLNWLSKNLDELFLPAEEKISLMSDFLDQISSLIIHRIEEPIDEISRFDILEFPDEPIDFKPFVQDIRQQMIVKADKLNSLSMQIESAVLHVIRMFFDRLGYQSKPFEQNIGDLDLMQLSPIQRLAIQMFVQNTSKSKQTTGSIANEWERFNELCNEFLSAFESRFIEALTICAKNTFEMIKTRANPTIIPMKNRLKKLRLYPLDTIDANTELQSSLIILNPSIDEMQQLMHQLVHYVLNIFHGVRKWGDVRDVQTQMIHEYPMYDFSELLSTDGTIEHQSENHQVKTYYPTIANNKELIKLYQNIGNFFIENSPRFEKELEEYYQFRDLWEMNKTHQAKKFLLFNPNYAAVRSIFSDFDETRESIKRMTDSKDINPFRYLIQPLKTNLLDEIRQLEFIFAKYIRSHYRTKFFTINDFFKKNEPRLNRQLRDLDDVRFVIHTLDTLKENFVQIDQTIEPLEEVYNLFKRYSIDIPQEEQLSIEMLRHTHERLLKRARQVTHELVNSEQTFLERFLFDRQQFQNDVNQFVEDYEHNGPMIEGLPAQEASERLTHFESNFTDLWKRFETMRNGEDLFGLDKTEYVHLQTIKKQLSYLKRLYGLYNNVIKTMEVYYETNWKDIRIEQINNEIQEFQNQMKKLPKGLKSWPAYSELKKKLDHFNECLPLLELLINPAMQSRHWERIEKLAKLTLPYTDPLLFSLKHVMNVPLIKSREEIEDISITAQKERDIESKLSSIESEWRQREFKFASFKNRGELLLRGQETSETLSAIDDSNLILAALASNRYNSFFKIQIQKYIADLAISSEILTKWMQVQNLWIYLEAVFVGGDIAKQMPQEARRFANVDKTWIKLMSKAKENANILSCCTSDETLLPLLNNMLEQLELCQKSLAGYLEAKRGVFPRFYFLSDPVMLEILGQASDPTKIQPYLSSFTEAVKSVEFHPKEIDHILSMTTKDDEKIPFHKEILAKGQVEEWLNDFLRTHQKTIHQCIRKSVEKMNYEDFNLHKFIEQEIAQLGLLLLQIIWTKRSEKALQDTSINKNILNETNKYFLEMLNQFIDKTTLDLSKYQRLKYETLITIHLHQRDIFQELYTTGIRSELDFDWAKQCRFYFRDDEDVLLVKITDVTFIYDNEALGCPERLVITPLTDRCYISIAQALAMSYGASPAGPAGTGKTETTKDMARTLGKYCIVQNCSDQFDYRGLGKTYKGLAISGCWGCFDEFNRINLPVLSVAAQQIQCLLQAKRERRREFLFTDGDKIILNNSFAIIITMNPGYAGRQELPENLKINFRSVAMMVPDRQIIMRVKLASGGFLENTNLAQKFFTLYKCCEDQLSKQVHYDYGLRNITAVLRTLGTVKRTRSKDPEETIVMRVLRDMNLSKLIDEDEPLFLSLLEDLFPSIKLDKEKYDDLQKAIGEKIQENGLINYNDWNLKIIQLYETQLVRHGIMVLGPSGAGKSKCCQVLMGALTLLGTNTRDYRMNPKSITASQMFGILDVATNDWTDGIFSTLWRRTLKAYEISSKAGIREAWWIILDGPVDAIWIENLNSVLDDNKLLTLANGDRIPMAPNVKLIFEVHNIDNASPATVSRCGMIFMSSTVLPWRPIFQAWANRQTKNVGNYLSEVLEKHFDEIFKLLLTKCTPKMKVYQCNYIKQIIDLLDGLLNKETDYTRSYLERLAIFALMWSMGALLELNDRAKLDQYFLDCPGAEIPKNMAQGSSILDYLVNDQGQWEHWSTRVEPWEYPKDETVEFASILVPNIDNVRITYLINILAKQEKAVLLIGEPGTAKTVIITSYLKHYDSEQHLTRIMNFSSITTNNFIQKTIESFVDKRVANTFGPSFGRKMTIFIDDINLPLINSWGDQEANEILRQLIEQKGFYSLTKPGDFLSIIDLQFLAAMCHPGGGRNDIPERLKRHFSIINCTLPSNQAVDHIFGSIGKYFCLERNFSSDILDLVEKSISATRILWQTAKGKFLPTPAKFHYIFNLRDLSRIWEGMLQIESEQCQNNPEIFLQLWKHECTRVLADRLVFNSEKEWFRKEQNRIARQTFGEIYRISMEEKDEVYFANFLREELEVTDDMAEDIDLADLVPKVYEPVISWDALQMKLINNMKKMNEEIRGSNMDLVFFKDAMIHLLRISRVINIPKGHLLLVGVGGSGKQSLTKLATYIAGYKYFQISISRTYTLNNFLDDLRTIYRRAGRLGQGIVFLLTDNDIKDDQFLEYLNNILSSGEISSLISREEMDETLSELSVKMKKEHPKRALTNENLLSYYRERLRQNLHVVLCFSPDNRKFRERALKFPALVSGCTIDWFHRWPLDALVAVSEVYLNRFEIFVQSNTIKRNVIELMADIHDDVSRICENYYEKFRRRTYVTPKSFLSFINAFKIYYGKQRDYYEKEKQKMKTGVQKLFEAAEQVQQITQELVAKEKHMAIANTEAATKVSEMEVLRSAAEMKTKEVQESKETAEILVKQVNEEKAIAEEELSAAEVILKEAEEAVKQIKGNTISNLRKLAKPPEAIMIVLDMALILMKRRLDPIRIDPNLEEPFYTPSKAEILRLLNFSGLLSTLLTIRELNDEIIELLAPYSEIKDLSEKARKAYKDLSTLKTWTDKIQSYHAINKTVIPIKDKVQKAENSLRKASRKLTRAERELERTQVGLAKCQEDFDSAMETKKTYQADYDALLKRRDDANTLISGLTGEKVRWNEQDKAFEQSIEKLIGNAILVTAFLSYCGPFNQEFRQRMLNEWQKQIQQRFIPHSENFNLIEQLNDEATIGEWNLQGLPNDDLSIQNGIIATSNYRYPLLIDPQLQGKSWIKNMERENDLVITTLNSKFFRQQLEDSISLGRPLLLEDVDEELDPMLDNILERNYIKLGLSLRVKIGDREVDVNSTFRFYLTTKLANPNYSPEVCARVSVIDFTVTQRGLEDQLLSLVIANERVELERERVTLARETTKNKRLLKELEENLLIKLTSIEGSVLDDPSLVEVLNANKRIAMEVKEKVAIAEETKHKISTAREEYRPVAIRGSIIYFLMSEIALVNHMYQISLQQFLGLFHESMLKSNKIAATQKRIQNINEYLTYRTWFYTTRGLYEDDRLMFTLLLALRIDLRRGKIRYDEFEVLIKGGASLDLNTCPTKIFRWLNDLSWLNLLELSRLKDFHDVIDRLQKNERAFKDWFEKESIDLPETYANLSTFQRFLFIRSISSDRTIAETRNYIQDSLGIKYVEVPVLSLEFIWEESECKTPLLALLSSGADPTSNIQALAKKKNVDLYIVSMGQGQEILARRYLQQTMTAGGWLLLQNAHLGLDYLDEFYETLIGTENFEALFRVWLTTETHPNFPIQILQSSIKFTNEPPQGVRAGLKRTYGLITQDKLEYIETMHWRPMLYTTSFLHSIVQERRKFGPLGWNIPYEFNQTDWEASVQYIQNHLDDINPKLGISWKALRYMISEIQYGGRITDDRDRRLMITYTKKWFSDLLLSPEWKFYDGYTIPTVKRLDEYFDHIDKLPGIDPPQIFGLHSNADITYSTNRAKTMLENIVNIQPKEANSNSSTGETRDKIVQNIAHDMLAKLPMNFIEHEVREKLKNMGVLNPMIIFLRQEIHRIDRVIRTVRNSLNDLQLAIDGIIILNDSLRQILDSIYDGRVPMDWARYSWQSSTLGFWFSELLDRYTQYNNWLTYGRPKCFWMTGFFNPNGFLTAMRQEVTRMHKGWSLDTVTIDNQVLRFYKDDIREAPTEGVYVYGLYLEGAGWDRKNSRLQESPNKVVYVQMPVIHIFAVNPTLTTQPKAIEKKSRFSPLRSKRTDQISLAPYIYMCPVYKKPMRTDLHFITMLKLASNEQAEHWILRGVALLCDMK